MGDRMTLSKQIEAFLNTCDECRRQYESNYQIVGLCNKRTTDFLHSLELDKITFQERSKLTTIEKRNRRKRREAKDIMEECEPLRNFLNDQAKAINILRNVLGETRKIERYHENRKYKKRVEKAV